MDETVEFFTSGSTGVAKRLVRTEEGLMADARALVAEFPELWQTGGVVASIPENHMYGALWRVRAPQVAGVPVDSSTVFSVEELIASCRRFTRILFVTTPSFLERMLHHPEVEEIRGAFSGIITSGSLLDKTTALETARRLGVCPLEIFGSTEVGTVAWRRRIEGDAWNVVSSVDVRVLDDGRLEVRSPFATLNPFVMSDAVEFVGSRQFLLRGRTDRQVKILEQLISLSEVECALEEHPLVSKARVESFGEGSVPRLGALLIPSPAALQRLRAESTGALMATLRMDLLSKIGGSAFPRRIRFVRAFPVNERGKTTAADVRNELFAWCREPATLDWRETADELVARFSFPSDCECFAGHFPGNPILPGVAQLYFVRHFARQSFRDFPETASYRRLKFQALVFPHVEIVLQVKRVGTGRFDFSIVAGERRCTSGLIVGGEA